MASYCALLGMPAELRNMIYEYAAFNEHSFSIKKTTRPRNNQHIATSSGFLLANRQISGEFSSVVQEAAFWPGTTIKIPIYDFNFRRLEKFISALSTSKQATLHWRLHARLIISALYNAELESLGRWMIFCSRNDLNIQYCVDDAKSGHVYPMEPPTEVQLYPFKRLSHHDAEATAILTALRDWQKRCYHRCYRLVSTDTSKTEICVRMDCGRFVQFQPNSEEESEMDWWKLDIDSRMRSEFGHTIPRVG